MYIQGTHKAHTCTDMHTNTHADTCTPTCMHIYALTCTHMYTYMHIYTHTHTHADKHETDADEHSTFSLHLHVFMLLLWEEATIFFFLEQVLSEKNSTGLDGHSIITSFKHLQRLNCSRIL